MSHSGFSRARNFAAVPYVPVAEAFEVVPTPRGVNRSEYAAGTMIPIIDQGLSVVAGYTDDQSLALPESEYVVFGDHTRAVKWVNFKFAPGADGTKVLRASEKLIPKFGYYCLANLDVPSRGYNRHWSVMSELRVPLPPLDLQDEIAKILDQYTELEKELEAELDAELAARRSQYAHYRSSFFSGSDNRRVVQLGELLELKSGKFKPAADIASAPDESNQYPCFGGNGIRGHVAAWSHEGDRVLIGRQGALSGNVRRATGRFYATEHAVVATPRESVNTSWLFHALTAMDLNQYVSKGAQPGLAVSNLKNLFIAVPALEEQAVIGETLDKFDALVNDLSIGLRAEFAARRKQYEYYRDKLLTFEEAPA